IVELRIARVIARMALRHNDDHSLPRTGQQHAIGVLQVRLPGWAGDVLPEFALESDVAPVLAGVAQVAVPDDPGPVDLQPLHVELRCSIFEIVRGSHVVLAVQKPVNRVDLRADVDCMWAESLGLRGDDETEPLSTACTFAEP